ncbi:hypothetical protein [Thalassotalea litorea]|uniref:hypothetical protein n=1 Tax=Thalassotalea litorea TaxID=2020715 RepID=UPI003735FFAE
MAKILERIKDNHKLIIMLIIGLCSLIIRLLMEYDFDDSALLYVGIPFAIAIALTFLKRPETENWKYTYLRLTITSLIVMLGSSVILFEGFVCVVMFMPIYFSVILLVFIIDAIRRYRIRKNQSTQYMQILPALILISAFEGVAPQLSFEREYSVEQSKVVSASIGEIHQQLQQPIDLNKPRHWLLSLFPMPYKIDAQSLQQGDIHTIYYRYHRWFVTNTHEGVMLLQLAEVSDNYIRTRIIENDSYIANYLNLHGTEIFLEPITASKTKVTLRIHYQRTLDPAWYFGPLQEFAIARSSELLIDEIITP